MMESMGGVRRNIYQAALAVLLALASVVTSHAAVFDDGNDRKFVKDLREKSPATLTNEEKAILAAANNVGLIRLCNGRSGGNAFLISYGGRPAVLTSGHMLVETEVGKVLCDDSKRRKAWYYPNASYYDHEEDEKAFALERIRLLFPPINLRSLLDQNFQLASAADFLVFLLDTELAGDVMPDGSRRRALLDSTQRPTSGKLVMIGVAPDMEKADRTVFQTGCGFVVRDDGLLYHNCDTIKGSSGSLLGVYEDGEIRVRGVHNFAPAGNETLPSVMSDIDSVWNGGVPIETILAATDKPLPEILAYDIQLHLSRTGCYSGKLDNEWGPASRRALDAFAAAAEIELPGTEPSAKLLAAVEKAAPEGAEVCRR